MFPIVSICLASTLFLFQLIAGEDFESNEACGYVEEEFRLDCGYSGISQNYCLSLGCCYIKSKIPGIPWCYYKNQTFYRTTIQPQVVAKKQLAKQSPQWLNDLLELSGKKIQIDKESYKANTRTSATSSKEDSLFVQEIQDELSCQKTYRLYKKINGHSFCQMDVTDRVACVRGKLLKLEGESECTACLNFDCCYDPIKRRRIDGRIAPHCYKTRRNLPTIASTQPTTTTTSKPNHVAPFPSPNSSSRLNSLLSIIEPNQIQTPDIPGEIRRPFSLTPSQKITPTQSSIYSDSERIFVATQQPTVSPIFFQNFQKPNSDILSIVMSLMNKHKKKSENLLVPPISSAQISPMSMIMKYILMKNSGTTPSIQDLLYNQPLKDASSNKLSSGKSSLYHPNGGLDSVSKPNSYNIIDFILNRPRTPEKKPKPTKQAPANILQNKATVPFINKTSFGVIPKSNQTIYAPDIKIDYEVTNETLPEEICLPENCGRRVTDRQIAQRIVGGQWAGGIEYWPWAASLRRTFTNDDRDTHICGAVLISKRWILTAAHCFVAYERRGKKIPGEREKFLAVYAVYLGQYYLHELTPTVQIYSINSFATHPKFDFNSLSYDVAVARLEGEVWLNDYVQLACLPEKTDPLYAGERTWIVGWGETRSVESQKQPKLKELPLPLVTESQCKKSWPLHFHDAWICTEGSYLEDACSGDSGGPLMKRGDDFRWNVIGIAIAGTKGCSTDEEDIKPGIYTKVGYFRDFIDSATKGLCENVEWKSSQ